MISCYFDIKLLISIMDKLAALEPLPAKQPSPKTKSQSKLDCNSKKPSYKLLRTAIEQSDMTKVASIL